ncbi:MAG: dihydrofolate reductase [Bacilli bacterium]
MKLIIIAAIGKNNELGLNNDLIWHLKDDMKFFKETTTNHIIAMGYNTFNSLPHLLSNRKHIVFCNNNIKPINDVTLYSDINKFLDDYKDTNESIFIIGGASIYKYFISLADELYITHIHSESKADVFFPRIESNKYMLNIVKQGVENNIEYKIIHYIKE